MFVAIRMITTTASEEAKEHGMVNYFLPHMYDTSNCIVYTGTHDNDTLQGWLMNLKEEQLVLVASYITGKTLSAQKALSLVKTGELRKLMIKTVMASNAVFAVIPFQDVAGVGNEGRMNTPSTTGTNWTWRAEKKAFTDLRAKELSELSYLYGRNLG